MPPAGSGLLPAPRHARFGNTRLRTSEPRVAQTSTLPAQGYRLQVHADGATIDAADPAGEFYARKTLAQLEAGDGTVVECEIEDWPDVAIRGVMLDVSRDKVPTMATLLALVERLVSWKVNELQLYTEHTFAYAGHEDVWREASPFTADEIAELDAFCAARHMTLTPNQNCLGHMERWLRHPPYRSLAIQPEGFTLAGVMHRPPMTMDPSNPGAIALASDLLGQLVPHFPHSGRVNVGLDEPFELSEARYGEYAEYLTKLRGLPELDGVELLVWGDILANHPALMDALPAGVTVAEWGYEAGHPFADRIGRLADAGRAVWACPGTSAWSSIFGRTTNMRTNQLGAAESSVAHAAAGWLVADWGDSGHLQYLPVSEPGLAHAAAVSWCLSANREIDLGGALDAQCFGGAGVGAALLALGDVHRFSERQVPNMAAFLLPLWLPHLRRAFVTDGEFDAIDAGLADAQGAIEQASIGRRDAELVRAELANAIALAQMVTADGRGRNAGDGSLPGIARTTRGELADRLEPIITTHEAVWRARNRPGGFTDSVSWLERLRDNYRSGTVDPTWLPPGLRPPPTASR